MSTTAAGAPSKGASRRSQTNPVGAPSPFDSGRQGSKTHLLVDKNGLPVSFAISGGNEYEMNAIDQTLLETMLVDDHRLDFGVVMVQVCAHDPHPP